MHVTETVSVLKVVGMDIKAERVMLPVLVTAKLLVVITVYKTSATPGL